MSTVIRTERSAQTLAHVPRLLGYTPRHALVVIPAARSRTMGALRVDLPRGTGVDEAAATCIGMVCRLADADSLTVIVYAEVFPGDGLPHDDVAARDGLPYDDLVQAIARRADACGLTLREALWSSGARWGCYLDPEFPAGGLPVPDLPVPDAGDGDGLADGAHLWDEGRGVGEHGRDAASGVDAHTRRQTADALAAVEAAVRALCDGDAPGDARVDPRALCATCRLDDLPALYEEALGLDPALVDPFTAALLIWALHRQATRDVALLQWGGAAGDGDAAADAQLRWEAGQEYPPELGERMWGDGARPDPQRLAAAQSLVHALAARAPVDHSAGVLAADAWLSWALGDPAGAAEAARQACDLEPEHPLAELVLSFLAVGHVPGWAT